MELAFAILFGLAIIIFVTAGISLKRYREITYNYTPIVKDDLSTEEKIFIQLVNDHRKELGLNALIPEKLASEVCLKQNLEDIKNNEPASHEHWDRMRRESKVNIDNCSHIYANNYTTANGFLTGI